MDFHFHPLTTCFLSVPSKIFLVEEQSKGCVTAPAAFLWTQPSALGAFVSAFSCSKLCFTQNFLKAVLIQKCENSIYINLRHINFASLMSQNSQNKSDL